MWWEMTKCYWKTSRTLKSLAQVIKKLSGLTGGLSVKAIYSKANGSLLKTIVIVSWTIKTSVNWQLRKGLLHRHTKYLVNRLKKWVVCAELSVFILPKSTNCNFSTSRLTQTCSVKRSVVYLVTNDLPLAVNLNHTFWHLNEPCVKIEFCFFTCFWRLWIAFSLRSTRPQGVPILTKFQKACFVGQSPWTS